MSNTKTVMSQAANTLAKPLDVEDVFSTYLYTGNGSTQTITNGIDLDGEGGLVWTKTRSVGDNHRLADTERGAGNGLFTDLTSAESSIAYCGVDAFYSDGYLSDYSGSYFNGEEIASWTFRKAPKFFDVVTYTGDGTSSQTINHNLGTTVGSIIVKRTDSTGEWNVFHRALTSAPETRALYLNLTSNYGTGPAWASTMPTSTSFTVGSTATTNISGATYVAYLFAHNDGDGGFNGGDIIKCGSYTGTAPEIDLGFEPQFILIKNITNDGSSSDWMMVDTMRGLNADGANSVWLKANESTAEETNANPIAPIPTPTGFRLTSSGSTGFGGANSDTYIYIAIRRGTKVPESATEVFDVSLLSSTSGMEVNTNFPVDMLISTTPANTQDNWLNDRLRGSRLSGPTQFLKTNNTDAEYTFASGGMGFDNNSGFTQNWWSGTTDIYWSWKRAPGFFDVVAYTGDNTSNRTVPHNLGVAPEMMWIKSRDNSGNWVVYHKDMGNAYRLILNTSDTVVGPSFAYWSNTSPSGSEFTLGDHADVNSSGSAYISFLFSSSPSVSKVGSYTGNGSSQTIDCGFTTGARFVLLKRTNGASDWHVYDTSRGIVSGNDPYLMLSSASAEVTSENSINPNNSGFVVVNDDGYNQIGDTWIFYAIA